jgi:hypothetical protein
MSAETFPNRYPKSFQLPSRCRKVSQSEKSSPCRFCPVCPRLGNCLLRCYSATRFSRYEGHELIVLPILLISPRSQACAASVLTLGCQIIRYLKPVSSAGSARRCRCGRCRQGYCEGRRHAIRQASIPCAHRSRAGRCGDRQRSGRSRARGDVSQHRTVRSTDSGCVFALIPGPMERSPFEALSTSSSISGRVHPQP